MGSNRTRALANDQNARVLMLILRLSVESGTARALFIPDYTDPIPFEKVV
jgi:hypothetical protein